MIYTADTNIFIPFLEDGLLDCDFVKFLRDTIYDSNVMVSPVVFSEVLSHKTATIEMWKVMSSFNMMKFTAGFWERVTIMRHDLSIKKNVVVKLPDSIIAQACIDYKATLITRDAGFRHYTDYGLKIYS